MVSQHDDVGLGETQLNQNVIAILKGTGVFLDKPFNIQAFFAWHDT